MKFPIHTEPEYELRPQPSYSEKRHVPSRGMYIGCGDDDDDTTVVSYQKTPNTPIENKRVSLPICRFRESPNTAFDFAIDICHL